MSASLITSRQNEIIEEFSLFDDWMDKYEHLIELGKDVPAIDDARKTDQHLIKGCQSRVWLAADETEDGTVLYYCRQRRHHYQRPGGPHGACPFRRTSQSHR